VFYTANSTSIFYAFRMHVRAMLHTCRPTAVLYTQFNDRARYWARWAGRARMVSSAQ